MGEGDVIANVTSCYNAFANREPGVCFEMFGLIARNAEDQHAPNSVTAEPVLGGERLDQTVGPQWQPLSNSWDYKCYLFDEFDLCRVKLRRPVHVVLQQRLQGLGEVTETGECEFDRRSDQVGN